MLYSGGLKMAVMSQIFFLFLIILVSGRPQEKIRSNLSFFEGNCLHLWEISSRKGLGAPSTFFSNWVKK